MKIRLFTIPNIVTLMNLFCGCLATLFAINGRLELAFYLIMLAAIFDFLDGFVARLLNSFSEMGKQLDSLSDVVSFGVAPSMILYSIYLSSGGEQWFAYGGYLLFVVALFSALRLAKFNIDVSQKEEFVGLPTPACGIFIAAVGYVFSSKAMVAEPIYVLIIAGCLSYLLVSPIKMFAFKFHNRSLRDNWLRYLFIALSVIGVSLFWVAAIPFIVVSYIVVSILYNLLLRAK